MCRKNREGLMEVNEMKPKKVLKNFTVMIVTLCSIIIFTACSGGDQNDLGVDLPQLSGDTVDAATMVLISAPPMQPADHIDRWSPSAQHEGCMTCHETGSGGAKQLPNNHFYENDPSNDLFRTYCVQCHGEQLDEKPAFNREN